MECERSFFVKTVFFDLFRRALTESRSACAVDCRNRAYLRCQDDYCNVMLERLFNACGKEAEFVYQQGIHDGVALLKRFGVIA